MLQGTAVLFSFVLPQILTKPEILKRNQTEMESVIVHPP